VSEQRKADTRRKIQLGGLVIVAGLGDRDAMEILGVLLLGMAQPGFGDAEALRAAGRQFVVSKVGK
jgi:Conjugal transfer protein TraD